MHKTSFFFKVLFPQLVWQIKEGPSDCNKVYITFDDGPHPQITPWIMELFEEKNFKATFFAVGENIKRYPNIAKQIVDRGHLIANHTFNHVNSWKTSNYDYMKNVLKCQEIIEDLELSTKKIFRPPYGKLTPKNIRFLLNHHYKIIMWDVLSKDYSQKMSVENCLKKTISHIKQGSVIVFHDSEKAYPLLKEVLPKVLDFLESEQLKSCHL